MTVRRLSQIIPGVPTSDGAGVSLRRSLGSRRGLYLDPFLMLDEFSSENPDDYIAGFPPHPHRGFETVTYMLDGHMRHEDHLGNVGELKSGGVQWMTAARGIIHSEMPQQESGRMRGFQLWINLPAKEKMKPAGYQDIQPDRIPTVTRGDGTQVKVLAGRYTQDGATTAGAINAEAGSHATDPLYLDVLLPAGARFSTAVAEGYNAFLYAYEGSVTVGEDARVLETQSLGIVSNGDAIEVQAGAAGARFILLAAQPLREPIVQYGPFVMNTHEEIEQAIRDYQNGELAKAA